MAWYGERVSTHLPRIKKPKKLGKIMGLCQNCNIWIGSREKRKGPCSRCGEPHGV